MKWRLTLIALAAALLAGCGLPPPAALEVKPAAVPWRPYQTGIASWYRDWRTASGERYHAHKLTAAHRTLRFGTMVRVTNLGNGRSCVVRINDRGPFIRGRVIDVSKAAAEQLGLTKSGIARVRLDLAAAGP